MAANTITGQEILFKMGADCGEVLSEFITAVTSQTVLVMRGLGRNFTYKYGLARVLGKGIRQITAWDEATETMTLASGFTGNVAAGESVKILGWDATKRDLMMDAINEAIRMSWQWWHRDTEVNAASATITLAAGDNNYDLPSGVGKLLKVGIQPSSTDAIEWFEPFQARFDVTGQEGAFEIVFHRMHDGYASGGTFADAFTGQALCLKYIGRESEITSETGTTQLPLDYFTTASVIYLENRLKQMTDENEIGLAQMLLGLLRERAQEAQNRLSKTKPRIEQVAKLKY